MSLGFLSPAPGAIARSPMEREAQAAGARFELRDGWKVAVEYAGPASAGVWFADSSHLGKFELHGAHELELGLAQRREGAWWCPLTRERALVICDLESTGRWRERLGGRAVELTCAYAALTVGGPLSRELLARFCALDLRAQSAPAGAFRPGSVARTPGYVLRERGERFLLLFGWALGRYLWETVADAAGALGGGPLGADALAPLGGELARA